MNDWYTEKLSQHQWSIKRLRVFKRDGYKCTVCGSGSKLEAHHTYYYDIFINPWLYPDISIITLCNECHLEYHKSVEVEIRPYPQKPLNKKPTRKKRKKKKKSLASIQLKQGLRAKKKNGDIIILDD